MPEDKIAKSGNTTLLTQANADKLIQTVSSGVPLDVATAFCGIHRETVRRWRRRGESAREINAGRRTPTERRYAAFATALDTAMASMTVRAQATVGLVMTESDRRLALDAAKFYLSRRDRKNYGATINAELTGPGGGPVLTSDLSGEEAWLAFTEMFGDPTAGDED